MVSSTPQSLRRQWADRVLQRSAFLNPLDRCLVRQVLGEGVRPADLAPVAGVSARTIQRRVRNLADRLTDPDVVFILRHHRRWPRQTASVALALWIRGLTQRQAAERLGLSLHQVRQQAQAIRALLVTQHAQSRP